MFIENYREIEEIKNKDLYLSTKAWSGAYMLYSKYQKQLYIVGDYDLNDIGQYCEPCRCVWLNEYKKSKIQDLELRFCPVYTKESFAKWLENEENDLEIVGYYKTNERYANKHFIIPQAKVKNYSYDSLY